MDETKDVLLKVALVKDIDFQNPKRSHLEILKDLSFDELLKKHKFQNFVELHQARTATLDTKELNKRFFRELSNWYFWAVPRVPFPKAPNDTDSEETHSAKSVIRLITRLMFVWFLEEKGLIDNELFNARELKRILENFAFVQSPNFSLPAREARRKTRRSVDSERKMLLLLSAIIEIVRIGKPISRRRKLIILPCRIAASTAVAINVFKSVRPDCIFAVTSFPVRIKLIVRSPIRTFGNLFSVFDETPTLKIIFVGLDGFRPEVFGKIETVLHGMFSPILQTTSGSLFEIFRLRLKNFG